MVGFENLGLNHKVLIPSQVYEILVALKAVALNHTLEGSSFPGNREFLLRGQELRFPATP